MGQALNIQAWTSWRFSVRAKPTSDPLRHVEETEIASFMKTKLIHIAASRKPKGEEADCQSAAG
jgi:hypothetical protein